MRRLFVVPLFFAIVFLMVEVFGFFSGFSYEGSSFNYYLAFVLMFFSVVFGGFFSFCIFPDFFYRNNACTCSPPVWRLVGFSFLGLFFLFVDRVYIQNIDYSIGLAAARTMWQESSSGRSGVSSLFSVFGNLLINFHYLAEILVLFYWDELRRPLLKILLIFLNVVLFSFLISGRTPLVVFLGLFLSTAILRVLFGVGSFFPARLRAVVFLLVPAVFIVAGFVFYLRIDGSDTDANKYVVLLGERLYGVEENNPFLLPPVFRAVAVYIGHVKWVGVSVFQDSIGYGIATFNEFFNIVATRLGWGDVKNLVWQYDGLWVPMFAMVYYDFGWFGVIFLCLFCFFVVFLMPLFCVLPKTKSLNVSWPLVASIFLCVIILIPFQAPTEIVEFIYTVALAFGFFVVALMKSPRA